MSGQDELYDLPDYTDAGLGGGADPVLRRAIAMQRMRSPFTGSAALENYQHARQLPNAFAAKRAAASSVTDARPAGSSPAANVPGGTRGLVEGYDKRLEDMQAELAEKRRDPNYTDLIAKQGMRGEQSMDLMRASILAGMGPADLKGMVNPLAQQSLALQAPRKIEGGEIDIEGNVSIDPGYKRQKAIETLRDDIAAMEKLKASAVDNAAKRLIQERQDNAQMELRYLIASTAAGNAGARRADAEARKDAAADKTKFTQSMTLSKEYDHRVKNFSEGMSAAQNLQQLAATPDAAQNAQAQVAMVFAFGRMLDPTSVVREGEYKIFEEARGWLETLGITPDRIRSGVRLTPDQIQRMAGVAAMVTNSAQERKAALQDYYAQKGTRWKLDPQDIMPDYNPGRGGSPAAPGGSPAAPAPRRSASPQEDDQYMRNPGGR